MAGGTCQLEALAPDQLAAVVEAHLRSFFREDVLEREIEQERLDRVELFLGLPSGSAP